MNNRFGQGTPSQPAVNVGKEQNQQQAMAEEAAWAMVGTRSGQWDSFWMAIYDNLKTFPEIVRILYNNSISTGSVLSPEVTAMLVGLFQNNNTSLVRELAMASDYVYSQSYMKLGSISAIDNMVFEVTKIIRVVDINRPGFSKLGLLTDELTDIAYDGDDSMQSLLTHNRWLVVFYVFAYVLDYIAGDSIANTMEQSTTYIKHAI